MVAKPKSLQFLPLFIFFFFPTGLMAAYFTVTNNCGHIVWPGLLSGAGTPPLSTTGFALDPGQSRTLDIPSSWSGRLWGRTYCSTNTSRFIFSCASGDCATGNLECSGSGAVPPATLAEFTLNSSNGLDFFDVSLVDGYNLPILVSPASPPAGSGGNCVPTGCLIDLNDPCPDDLKVILSISDGRSQSVACRSACEAFGSPEFCCNGDFGNPNTCKPSYYSQFFKNACPRSYSYAYDDATSTFTCPSGGDYIITFCPSISSVKSGDNDPRVSGLPLINSTMVFYGHAEKLRRFSAILLLVLWFLV